MTFIQATEIIGEEGSVTKSTQKVPKKKSLYREVLRTFPSSSQTSQCDPNKK
jgi:hypothetical protein